MSLGLFKKISKSSANKQSHSYENVQATSVSSPGNNEKKKQHRNHEADYINVQFEDKNGRRHLAVLGETRRQPKQSGTDKSAGAFVSSTKSTDKTMPEHELAKSNRQEPKQGSGSKSLTVYSRTDSDSSSNDITDESESPDAKKRELEHYNRLKLNPSCPPRNKKALKGIKILTNPKQQQSLHLALHSSELFKQRQQSNSTDEPRDTRDTSATAGEKKQAVKYKKEGHINRLLSITGRPIRHSTSFVSSFSRTVGDVHGLHPQDNNLHMKTSKKSMRVVGKRSNSFSDVETMRVAICESSQFSKTTTLTRTQSPLTCHTDVRHMQKSDTLSNTGSSDTLNEAWNDACLATFSYSNVPFIDAVETVTFTHNGGQYTSESHDIRITIPKGAIKKHMVVHLQVGVAIYGPFSFPDANRPVSPIIWISVTPNTNLKKPIEITVPHFVRASSQSSPKNLVFLKAACRIKSTSRTKKYEAKYHFSKVAENNQQFNNESYGTVFTKDSCFFCIVGDTISNSTLRANYCLIPVIPKPVAQTTWRIHYYVIYLLKTYIHVSVNDNKHAKVLNISRNMKYSIKEVLDKAPSSAKSQYQLLQKKYYSISGRHAYMRWPCFHRLLENSHSHMETC